MGDGVFCRVQSALSLQWLQARSLGCRLDRLGLLDLIQHTHTTGVVSCPDHNPSGCGLGTRYISGSTCAIDLHCACAVRATFTRSKVGVALNPGHWRGQDE